MPYYPEKKPVSSGDGQKQTGMTEKQKRLFRLSFAALSCFLILYGSVSLIRYFSDLNASRSTARELQQVYRRMNRSRQQRLVVAARRLRTGETQDRLTIRASSSH